GPDVFDREQVGMMHRAQGLQGADLDRGDGVGTAVHELEGARRPVGPLRLPDLAPAAAADRPFQAIAREGLQARRQTEYTYRHGFLPSPGEMPVGEARHISPAEL